MESQLSRGDLLRRGAGAALAVAAGGSLGLRVPEALGAGDQVPSYTYSIWNYDNADTLKDVKKAFADAAKRVRSAKVSVKISNLTGSGATLYPSKITGLIASGNPPDAWESWGGTLAAPYIKVKGVRPLDDWFAKYGWNKKLSAAARVLCSVNGRPMGVPFNLISMPVFYNKKAFADAGVTPPKTYDQWLKVNDALLDAGYTPIEHGNIDGWDAMRVFEHLLEVTAGPELHDKLTNFEVSWNRSAVVEAFELFKEWGDKYLPKGWVGTTANDALLLFTSGKAAQTITGAWVVAQLSGAGANTADFSFFIPPDEKGPARMAGFVQQYLVSSKLKGKKLNALGDLLNAFVAKDIQAKYMINGSTATKGAVPKGDPLLIRYLAATQRGKLYTIQDQAMSTKLATAYFDIQTKVGQGTMTPRQAAAAMAAAVKRNQ